jgi:hypothetical protein
MEKNYCQGLGFSLLVSSAWDDFMLSFKFNLGILMGLLESVVKKNPPKDFDSLQER